MTTDTTPPVNYTIIADMIDYLVAHHATLPDLDALARRAGYEPTYFQKLFSRMVGLSPKKLLQFMTMSRARDLLQQGYPTLDAAWQSGLSGNGRLHDLFVSCIAASPGDVQRRGAGMTIRYGYHPTPLGEILVGVTDRGVCWLGFRVDEKRDVPHDRMTRFWPRAAFIEDTAATAPAASHIMSIWDGTADRSRKLPLYLHGTNFQIQVWQALLKIPSGATVSYKSLACHLNNPKASRAVGGAVGDNPISLLIPCHRVIQASGIVDNYGWGSPRKKALLSIEGRMLMPAEGDND